MSTAESAVRIQAVGGPTLIIEIDGLRLLTDPTFDPPGSYAVGTRHLTKTTGPALDLAAVGAVDVVLLSHDQHPDNLDAKGRDLLPAASTVLSTPMAAGRMAGVTGLTPWQEVRLPRPGGGALVVTATPAQHGPDGTEHLTGPVTGFVVSGTGLPTVYISGDNASMRTVDQVAQRFPVIDVAVLFAGAARTPLLGDAYLTLTSDQAAEATRRLGVRWIVPAHFDSWSHYSEGADRLRAAFRDADLADRLVLPAPGEVVVLPSESMDEQAVSSW